MIRFYDCWESNCELIYIFDQVTKHEHLQYHLSGKLITQDEMKSQLNVMWNEHHFRKSDAELQAFEDELKNQCQLKSHSGKRE